MRILLVNPNYRKVYRTVSREATMILPPIGLAYVAGSVRANGYEVEILDLAALDLDDNQAKQEIERAKPDVVGITAVTNTIEEAYAIASIAKKCGARVVVGGAHPSIMPEQTLMECSDIDIVVIGEGEYTLVDIIGGKPLKEIAGIAFRDGHGMTTTEARHPIQNLDELPFPARDLLPRERYWTPGVRRYPFDALVTSRGCPYRCSFCTVQTVHGRRFRWRSPENVLTEIDELVNRYGVEEINIRDDNFTLRPSRVEEICDGLIERDYDLIWKLGNGVRVDRVSPGLLMKMRKAGCYKVAFGIEAGNQRVLDTIGKDETLEEIEAAVEWAKNAGLATEGFFMIGNEGEDEETIRQTIRFAKRLDLDFAQFQICIPFPGSRYYHRILAEGTLLAESWREFNAFDRPIFEHGKLTPDLMESMQKAAYREYYLRPRMILRRLLEIRSLKQLDAYIRAGLGIVRLQRTRS